MFRPLLQRQARTVQNLRLKLYSSSALAVNHYGDREVTEMTVKPFSAIPGPKPLPLLRNALEFKNNLSTLHVYLEECYEKYGEIFKLEAPGGNNFVHISDPSVLEKVLRQEGKYPRREASISSNLAWILKKLDLESPLPFKRCQARVLNSFYHLGEDWKQARRAINKQILPSNVQTYAAGINNVVADFVEHMESVRDVEGRVKDIGVPLRRLLTATTAKMVYNNELDVFKNPKQETEEFINAIHMLFDCLFRLQIDPPFYRLYPNKLYRDTKRGFNVIKNYGLKNAEETLKAIKAGEERPVQGLLEQWLREGKMTEAEAIMTSGDMFAAGVDTTASQAAFTLHCMAKNPEAQEKLYEEIKSVLGERTYPTPEDLSNMPYLKGCVMESFRVEPSGVVVARLLPYDVNIMGYNIPAETAIIYLNHIAGKKESLFPNPDKFDPDRWTRDKPHPFSVLPFGFGPRGCYGKRIAELELKLTLCQITQKYVLKTDVEKVNVDFAAVVRPFGDLPLYFEDRK